MQTNYTPSKLQLENNPALVSRELCYRCGKPIGDREHTVNEDAMVRHYDCADRRLDAYWVKAAAVVLTGAVIDYETTSIEAAAFTMATLDSASIRFSRVSNNRDDDTPEFLSAIRTAYRQWVNPTYRTPSSVSR